MADQGNSTCLECTEEQLPVTFQDGNETGHEFCVEGYSDANGSLNENAVDIAQAGMTCALQDPCYSRDVIETLPELPCSSVRLTHNIASTSDSGAAFIEALKNRYRKTKAITPVILDKRAELEDSKKDYFVDLIIEERNLLGLPSGNKEVSLKELFYTEREEGRRNKRTILITGDAGFGKTTLSRKLCFDWTFPGENYLSSFDLVLDIPLKSIGSLPDTNSLSKIKSSVLNEIYLDTGYEMPGDTILQDMNILFILDGLDETDETEEVISFLDEHQNRFQSNSLKGSWTTIVTSRPYAIEKCQRLLRLFDRRLSVSGFSADSQRKYIHKMLQEDSANKLIERVRRDSFLTSVSKSPLMLHLICCVHGRDGSSSISCRTELYLQIFKLRIEFCAVKLGRKDIHWRFGEISSIKEDTLFVQLGEIANRYLLNEEGRITKESLAEKFKEEFEFVIGLGILVAVPTLSNMKPITIYEFTHITFAEFLSAIYVADKVTRSELSLDTNFDEVLETGFFTGVLGKKIVEIDVVSMWISRLGITLSRLHDIKNEACLSGETWESFCSRIKRISYDCLSNDIELLYSTDLPNLQETIIIFNPPVSVGYELIFEASKLFLLKFRSCELLRITMAINISYLPSDEENDGFRFIGMEGTMTNLINLANFMRSTNAGDTICVHVLARDVELVDVSDLSNQEGSFLGRFNIKPIGILPDVLPNSTGPYGQWLYYTWKIGNIEIRYHIASEDDYVRKLAVPIIGVTPDEYKTISSEPFLHESALKVGGFKSSAKSNAAKDLKIPTTFGHVGRSTFLERLKEFRKEAVSPRDKKETITSGHSTESSFLSLLKKKYCGVTGSSLEDVLGDSDFSYLSNRLYGINEREVYTSDSEGFEFVATSHFTCNN